MIAKRVHERGVALGNGGWVRFDEVPDEVFFVRFSDVGGELHPTELYAQSDEGLDLRRFNALKPEMVRWVRLPDIASSIRGRIQVPSPDLRRLASHFASTFGSQAKHWVADSMRAQFPGARQAPLGDESRERRRYKRIDANVKRLAEGARVDPQAREDLYARVGRIVSELQSMGYRNHAAVIADESGVEVKQAHAWVRRARERGYLTADPYKRGRPKAGS